MAFESVNYQCPACGGPLHFASAEQKLVCDYCDSRFEVEEVEALYRGARTRPMPKPMPQPRLPNLLSTMPCRSWLKTPATSARRAAPN